MCREREAVCAGLGDLDTIEHAVDAIARDVERLVERGAVTADENVAFVALIEDLWISVIRMRRGLIRGPMPGASGDADMTDLIRTITLLRSDIAFARVRQRR